MNKTLRGKRHIRAHHVVRITREKRRAKKFQKFLRQITAKMNKLRIEFNAVRNTMDRATKEISIVFGVLMGIHDE